MGIKRSFTIIRTSKNGKVVIAVDVENSNSILSYANSDERHKKKFKFITELILENKACKDLFRQEKISMACAQVYAMRLFTGQENDRIYCQKIERKDATYIILCELLEKKKNTKLKHREITLINKVARYEYEIE